MILTEEEARTKWCPFARVDCTASNRPNPGDTVDTSAGWPPCVASQCAVWQWSGGSIGGGGRRGYCGLGGEPRGAAR